LAVCAPAEAQLTVLHQFTGGADGGTPYAAPISDAAGNLYGTTYSGGASGFGAAYELSPPAAGGTDWNETVLYSFAGGLDGAGPNGSLVFDKAGNLYGMTGAGTTANKMIYDGSVFELIPPGGKAGWQHKILRQFTDAGKIHGEFPEFAALVLDAHGTLYGTSGAPNIFSLSPPATAGGVWQFSNLTYVYNSKKNGSLAFDKAGALYGVSRASTNYANEGIVYQLTPPTSGQTAWTEKTLVTFDRPDPENGPFAGVTIAADGTIYGAGGNAVYMLVRPSGAQSKWSFTTLYAFQGGIYGNNPMDGAYPMGPVALGVNLYGTTGTGGSAQCAVPPPLLTISLIPGVASSIG
jgi:uncharacterized repeat protein (TIGR03803 family)